MCVAFPCGAGIISLIISVILSSYRLLYSVVGMLGVAIFAFAVAVFMYNHPPFPENNVVIREERHRDDLWSA